MLQWDLSLRSVVIYRIDTVLLGVLFAFICYEFPLFWKKNKFRFAVFGIALLLILLLCLGYFAFKIQDYPFFWNVICLPINALALVCFLPFFSEWKVGPQPLRKPVVLISEISYAIYLLHYSFVLYLMKYFINTAQFTLIQLHLFTLIYLVITFFLSYLMYTYFEKPMMKLKDLKF